MTAKHTSGPWEIHPEYSPLCIRTEDDRIVADCSGTGRPKEEARANAVLIKAAPLMLKALVKAEQVIENAVMAGCDDPDTMQHALAHHPTLMDIRAAIAKAKGNAP